MAKVLFPIKWKEKLAQCISQIQSALELANELKPDCLLKTLVFWPHANELITLIISIVESVSTLGHDTDPREEYYLDNLMLRFGYSKENNIQELKAWPPLRELVLNINIFFVDLPPKQCGLPRKKNMQRLSYKVILDLDI